MLLPPRRFEPGEYAWARVDGKVYFCRIGGYEDARQLVSQHAHNRIGRAWQGLYDGWAYHIRLEGVEEEFQARRVVRECDLDKTDEHTFQLTSE